MKTVGLTYLLLLLLCPWAAGQSVVRTLLSTTGEFKSDNGYSISYSVGELSVSSETSGKYILTQGFQQLYLDTVIGPVPCEDETCIEFIKVFPNPVKEKLNIILNKTGINDFTMEIYNSKGGKVFQRKYSGVVYTTKIEFDFTDFPKELYLIHIYSADGHLYDKFKIIKI